MGPLDRGLQAWCAVKRDTEAAAQLTNPALWGCWSMYANRVDVATQLVTQLAWSTVAEP